MSTISFGLVVLANAMALISLGGGFYEFVVVDPFWPKRPELIQPSRGGISRRRFWIPAHTLFELALLSALVLVWSQSVLRQWLLIALASHAIMRLWSAFDFIPHALAFERADPASITETDARRWTSRSLGRLPFDLVTCGAMMASFAAAVELR